MSATRLPRNSRLVPILAMLAALALPRAAAAQLTYVVPGTHDTIQDAVDATAESPVIIMVVGGVHDAVALSDVTDVSIIGQGSPIILGAVGDAISLTNCTDVSVSGMLVTQPTGDGISVTDSVGTVIEKCATTLTGGAGLRVHDSPDLIVQRCEFIASGTDGMAIDGSETYGLIARNDVLGTGGITDGIVVDDARGITFDRNTVRAATRHGINLRTASHCRLVGNRVDIALVSGIRVDGNNNLVEKSRITDAGNRGIDVRGTGNVVTRNRIDNATSFGIYVDALALGNAFTFNAVIGGLLDGIRVDASGTTLTGNNVVGVARNGIVLAGVGLHIVERNAVSKALGDAMVITDGTSNSMLIANKVSKCDRGLVVSGDDTFISRMKGSGNLKQDFVDAADGTTVMASKFGVALIFE